MLTWIRCRALLAVAPDVTSFTVLRITQGLFMASAFSLTLAHLGEQCGAMDAGGAFAAYITGNVARIGDEIDDLVRRDRAHDAKLKRNLLDEVLRYLLGNSRMVKHGLKM